MSSLQPALLPSLSSIAQQPSKSNAYQAPASLDRTPSASSLRSFGSLSFSSSAGPGSDGSSSPPSSPETDAHPSRSNSPPTQLQEEAEEEEDEVSPAPLPSYVIRPKGIAERERERASGFNSGKKNSLVAQMQRKRADSLKWSKYKNMGSGVIELNLCQDELRRAN